MRTLLHAMAFLLVGTGGAAQGRPAFASVDTSHYFKLKPTNKKIRWVITGNVVVYGGTMVALYETWYKNYPQSNFHFFNDNKEWLQVDKAGHAWSAYNEGRTSAAVWKWAGLGHDKAVWIGGLSGLGYQSIIEILDGFSSEWGFSWGDYLANVTGSGLFIGQELGWKEQRVLFKFSALQRNYGDPVLDQRAEAIYGRSLPERLLKDYNAQTYWLSANLGSFLKAVHLPGWLNIAVGYGADGMFGAVNNSWTGKNAERYDRTDLKRYRQFYLAPDIDFTRIKTKSKTIRTVFFLLNSLKFPAPSIEFSGKFVKWHLVYF